ncbi:hypothetical protein SH449x_003763 [Pirellulaceae bacterium SH449]
MQQELPLQQSQASHLQAEQLHASHVQSAPQVSQAHTSQSQAEHAHSVQSQPAFDATGPFAAVVHGAADGVQHESATQHAPLWTGLAAEQQTVISTLGVGHSGQPQSVHKHDSDGSQPPTVEFAFWENQVEGHAPRKQLFLFASVLIAIVATVPTKNVATVSIVNLNIDKPQFLKWSLTSTELKNHGMHEACLTDQQRMTHSKRCLRRGGG